MNQPINQSINQSTNQSINKSINQSIVFAPVYLFICFVILIISANVGTSGGYPVYEDRDTFYTALAEFTVDGDNERFQSDLAYNADGETEARKHTHAYIIPITVLCLVLGS